jgi:hypothetical protein
LPRLFQSITIGRFIEAISAKAITQGEVEFTKNRHHLRVVNPGFDQLSLGIDILLEVNNYIVASEIPFSKHLNMLQLDNTLHFSIMICVC